MNAEEAVAPGFAPAFAPAFEVPAEARRAHASLGPLNEEFLDFVAATPQARRLASFASIDDQRFSPLMPWPFFVGGALRRELAQAPVEVTALIRRVPALVFKNDPDKVASFYRLPSAEQAALVLAEPNGFEAAIGRADLVLGEQGLRCLEINLGCPGGIECGDQPLLYSSLPVLKPFFVRHGARLSSCDPLRELLRHVIVDLLATLPVPELNVAILAAVYAPAEVREALSRRLRSLHQELLAELVPGRPGEAWLTTCEALEPGSHGIALGGRPLAAVVELEQTGWQSTFRYFKARQVNLYNGPATAILSDKRNLALLSELERSPWLSPAEQQAVARWVPWTRQVKPGYTHRDGERVFLPELIAAQRQRLVLKPGRSGQGLDVLLGPSTTAARWDEALRGALSSRDWVVQDYHPSLPFLCRHGEEGGCLHDVVWGIFVFGRRYGGGFLRALPRGRHQPINSSRGATEAVFFEVD